MSTLPGLVDLQVNGYLGVDFSSEELSVESFLRAARALYAHGTAAFLPTLITSPLSRYRRNLSIIDKALQRDSRIAQMVLGVHLEGPFISREDGARGAHPLNCVLSPSVDVLEQILSSAQVPVRLLTMAAELDGAAEVCAAAVRRGIRVSLGHQLGGERCSARLIEAGASAFTHIGNALPHLIARHDNPVYSALLHEETAAMAIGDGHHVPAEFLRLVIRAKHRDRFIVVSDAAPVAGMPPGGYRTLGHDAILSDTGRLYSPTTGYLVGSSYTLLDCARYLLESGVATGSDILAWCVYNPLHYLGLTDREAALPRLLELDAGAKQLSVAAASS